MTAAKADIGLQLVVNPPQAVTVTPPDTAALEATYRADILPISQFLITDATSYVEANRYWTQASDYVTSVEGLFSGPKKAANAAHKAITGLERQFLEPAKKIADHMGNEIKRWDREQTRLRQIEEEKERLRRVAEAAAETARLRAQAEADRQREIAELAASAEDLAPWEEEEAREQIAVLTAEPIVIQPIEIEPVRFPSMVPTVMGGPRLANKPWRAEVFNEDAFWGAAYKDKSLRRFFVFDMPALNVKARECGKDLENVLPGVRGVQDQTLRRS